MKKKLTRGIVAAGLAASMVMSTGIAALAAVSYTHLDVYKRQTLYR